jgi:Protein of unknown function (DUF2905)
MASPDCSAPNFIGRGAAAASHSRVLIIIGLVIEAVGFLKLGRLPGDDGFTFDAPIAANSLISVVLSLIL